MHALQDDQHGVATLNVDVVDGVIREVWCDEFVPHYACSIRYLRPTGRRGRAYGYGDTPELAFNDAKSTAEYILQNIKPLSIPAQ